MKDAVLDAALRAALEATGARRGWIVSTLVGELRVAAVAGDTEAVIGALVPTDAPAAFAAATGQPAARAVHPKDVAAIGAAGSRGAPTALLTVPTGEGLGVIELADKADGSTFTIDDVEIVSLIADVVAAALVATATVAQVPTPDDLAVALHRLHSSDRGRYAVVAAALSALLGSA